jgi:starch-binding outer membrane protein, SusD/RagB family
MRKILNKYLIKLFLVIVMIIPVSCSDEFLDVENLNNPTDGSFYKTKEDYLLALNSCYVGLSNQGVYGLNMNLLFGTFEDRILFEDVSWDKMSSFNPANNRVADMWNGIYTGLFRTNVFLYNLYRSGEIDGFTPALRAQYEAEARALRAKLNFLVVTIFDRPIFYTHNDWPLDPAEKFTNGNPADFWALIKSDLLFARDVLPTKYPDTEVGRITSGAANALLGKAMLYKHFYFYARNGQLSSTEDVADLELAMDAFTRVIESNVYSLVQPKNPKTYHDYLYAYLSNFSYVDLPAGNNIYKGFNTTESIWEIQYSDERIADAWLPGQHRSGALNYIYFSPFGFRNHEYHPDLWLAYETQGTPAGWDRDPRAYANIYRVGDTLDFRTASPNFNRKFTRTMTKAQALSRGLFETDVDYGSNAFGLKKYYFPPYYENNAPNNDPINRVVIRYADVLLMYAEVSFILNKNTSLGLGYLNEVRARMGMAPVGSLTAEAIIHERDVELAGESLRWFDLVRWSYDAGMWGIDMQQVLRRQDGLTGTGSFFTKGKHEFLPIPTREININSGRLKQNNGW